MKKSFDIRLGSYDVQVPDVAVSHIVKEMVNLILKGNDSRPARIISNEYCVIDKLAGGEKIIRDEDTSCPIAFDATPAECYHYMSTKDKNILLDRARKQVEHMKALVAKMSQYEWFCETYRSILPIKDGGLTVAKMLYSSNVPRFFYGRAGNVTALYDSAKREFTLHNTWHFRYDDCNFFVNWGSMRVDRSMVIDYSIDKYEQYKQEASKVAACKEGRIIDFGNILQTELNKKWLDEWMGKLTLAFEKAFAKHGIKFNAMEA